MIVKDSEALNLMQGSEDKYITSKFRMLIPGKNLSIVSEPDADNSSSSKKQP